MAAGAAVQVLDYPVRPIVQVVPTQNPKVVEVINPIQSASIAAAVAAAIAALTLDQITGLRDALNAKATPADITAAVTALINNSPAALDTLRELADALGDDPNYAATTATALANRLRIDLAQALTTAQKAQGRANLDALATTGDASGVSVTLTGGASAVLRDLVAALQAAISARLVASNNLSDLQDAKAARRNLGLEKLTSIGDAAYTILPTDRTIALAATLTANRTWTLPAASSVNPGASLRILDKAGGVSTTFRLTVAAAGTDTINGASSSAFSAPYTDFLVTSDGVSAWTYDVQGLARGGTGATTAAAARANLGAAESGANNSITSLTGLTTPLSAGQGGTGFASLAALAGQLAVSGALALGLSGTGCITYTPTAYTQDGNPTVDVVAAIQAAWDAATAFGLPLMLTPGPAVTGSIDVRISKALKGTVNGARLRTDGRVKLHAYASDFTNTVAPGFTAAQISTANVVYFGPGVDDTPGTGTYISNVGAERLTLVYHPPVDGNGNRVASLNNVNGLTFDRCNYPKARDIDVSGLNAGYLFAFTSCTQVDFDGLTLHDSSMVLDTASTDVTWRNAQLTGLAAEDNYIGRRIPPTQGGSVRNVKIWGLSSNRTGRQLDGANDGGSDGLIYSNIRVDGVNEAFDVACTNGLFIGLNTTNCDCNVKMVHGATGNFFEGRSSGAGITNSQRACIEFGTGNVRDTAYNQVIWHAVGYQGVRLWSADGELTTAFILNADRTTTSGATTYNRGNRLTFVARNCTTTRLCGGAGSGKDRVFVFDVDALTLTNSGGTDPASSFWYMTSNANDRFIRIGGPATPYAATIADARAFGANFGTGLFDMINGGKLNLQGGTELDLISGFTGTGYVQRTGTNAWSTTTALTGTALTIAGNATISGATQPVTITRAAAAGAGVIALSLINGNASSSAGTEVSIDFACYTGGVNLRSAQLAAIDEGTNQVSMVVRTASAAAPAEHTRFNYAGHLMMGGSAVANVVISALRHQRLRSYTVATLPTSGVSIGDLARASDGRAVTSTGALEAAGAGTGCAVERAASGVWRVIGTNQQAAA